MSRMHAIVDAAAARLPRTGDAPSAPVPGLAPRGAQSARYLRPHYASGALPVRFHIA